MEITLPTVIQAGEERVRKNRTGVPLCLIRVPERGKNRGIVKDKKAKKATGRGCGRV
jgi:hypothetical protein